MNTINVFATKFQANSETIRPGLFRSLNGGGDIQVRLMACLKFSKISTTVSKKGKMPIIIMLSFCPGRSCHLAR